MFSNSFIIAGMSSSKSSHHNPNLNVWGNNNVNPSGGLGASSFGDSFSQSRSHYQSGYLPSASQPNASPQGHQRVDEVPVASTAGDHPFSFSASRRPRTPTAASSTSSTPLYVIVLSYPADKYNVTVEYFNSLGVTTDADPSTEIIDCFRIGYRDPGDATRTVRKNDEVLGRSWMIDAKWAVSGFLSLG
ncbi:hypothetical protein K435DRAFT_967003 [Dendrothele bispora CBS 962.96]|uniref:RRM Nup35-type domain-containing protein n=1 Tax=Dendrothele bispora (strain CBS 962.96) TaxID=1314807 RepID=A0A4S8LY43_DENBC|nr:hypothetical protein K435DRAFT_967003 [Dendrothele bispora CBS 962.96]